MSESTPETSAQFIESLSTHFSEQFSQNRALLSFADYLEEVKANPERHTRDTARYLQDAILSYGFSEHSRSYGEVKRYHIFDAPFDQGIDAVSGQEEAQKQLIGLLNDFVREGRVNKLILLHGPNGSAKTSMIACLQRGLEAYSETEEGVLYSFSWLFPRKQNDRGGGIGFGSGRGSDNVASFSDLKAGSIEARVANELRDHPLLLLPREARKDFLTSIFSADIATDDDSSSDERDQLIQARLDALPRYIIDGELSPQSASIFEALTKAYQGDLQEVYKHIQVERFTISRRYRRGATTIDPQLRVDAQARQVTADRSLASLPASLQHLNLFEPMGHLVEGNRGVIEYNDLLKRPVEAFKYLLATTESNAVRLDQLTFFIDAILIGSCNFEMLQAFLEMPDFSSFKGRIELIRVPYLRDIDAERAVYDQTIKTLQRRVFVTPDVGDWLASWAVMTRLERPQPVHFPKQLRSVIEGLSPLEKAELYRKGRAPSHLSLDERRLLTQHVVELYQEPISGGIYEGWLGASPRELKGLLLSMGRPNEDHHDINVGATADVNHHFISPIRLFEALKSLCKEDSVYAFLRRKASGKFYQPKAFVDELKEAYLKWFKEQLFNVMGLTEPEGELNQLKDYIHHLRYKLSGEKVVNPHTGISEDPNEILLREVERRLGVKSDVDQARSNMLHQIAKWRIENPDSELDYTEIFEDELRTLHSSYLEETREVALQRTKELREYLEGELTLPEDVQQRTLKSLTGLKSSMGYHEESILEALHTLQRHLNE